MPLFLLLSMLRVPLFRGLSLFVCCMRDRNRGKVGTDAFHLRVDHLVVDRPWAGRARDACGRVCFEVLSAGNQEAERWCTAYGRGRF